MTDVTDLRQQFQEILDVLRTNRAELRAVPDLVAARPGYDPREVKELVPALILAFRPPHRPSREDWAKKFGVRAAEVEATPEEQLRAQQYPGAISEFESLLVSPPAFAPPRRGTYEPPSGPGTPSLRAVEEEMKLTLSASPDAGWPVLKEFLSNRVRERMTVGMYQFTAEHIYKALRDNLKNGAAVLHLGLHPAPEPIAETGTKADDIYGEEILKRFQRYLGSRFDFSWASVGKNGAFTSAYHIKVAVADGERFWLSSGNWQTSNQPPFDPLSEPDELPERFGSKYNREYHAVVEHKGLAATFEAFLDYDRSLPQPYDRAAEPQLPDLFVPAEDAEALAFVPRTYHEPLRLERKVKVQPLLTPDNYPRQVLELVRSARQKLYVQNQYINLNPSGDLAEFREIVDALLKQIDAGLDVRIIVRDLMQPEKFDLLYALGFPKERFKVLGACHAKLIVADGARVVLGSHNLSNDGAVTNRDASLLFDDQEIAEYFEQIFLEDWERARPPRPRRQPRVARDGERSFSGGRRVPWSGWSDEAPCIVPPVTRTPPQPQPPPKPPKDLPHVFGVVPPGIPPEDELVVFNGIDAKSGQYLRAPSKLSELAKRLRDSGAEAREAEKDAVRRRMGESFAPPAGFDANDVQKVGWAVLYGASTPQSVKDRLQPLLAHRKTRAGRFFQEITVQRGETVSAFLSRNGVSLGSGVKPHRIGYHVLIVASPEDVSFEFQYLLDLEYSVGRLHFDAPLEKAYSSYAEAVVAYELGRTPARPRELTYWGPAHAGDKATELSSKYMIGSLAAGEPEFESVAARMGYPQTVFRGPEASKAKLADALCGGATKPAIVFTAGHGMGLPLGDANQLAVQGALLTADWTGFNSISAAHYLAAADLGDDADASGLVAFFFACFGAGTPADDTFLGEGQITPKPFVARLPQRLLGHPKHPALAVVGHVDRAWGFSIKPRGASDPQLGCYEAFIARVLAGECVGNGMADLNGRAAILAADLADTLMPGKRPPSDQELVWTWLQRNDARAYVLLGDPAVRLR